MFSLCVGRCCKCVQFVAVGGVLFEGGASPLLLGMQLQTCATVPDSDCGTAFSQQLVHRSVEFCMWRSIYQLKMVSGTAAGKVLIK